MIYKVLHLFLSTLYRRSFYAALNASKLVLLLLAKLAHGLAT